MKPKLITDIEELQNSIKNYTNIIPLTHSGNVYSGISVGIKAYTDGLPLCVKFDTDSTGNISVNLNNLGAKNVVDYFGNQVNNVRANLIANLRYEATSGTFILQGKGGGGNASARGLLLGETATVDSGSITGTMPNNGALILTPSTTKKTIATGYHNGSGYVVGEANLVPSNILAGVSIFNVIGSYIPPAGLDTYDATATAGDLLVGKTAYVKGSKIYGSYVAQAGLDTYDATATSGDLLVGKTAYAKGSKIYGTHTESGVGYATGSTNVIYTSTGWNTTTEHMSFIPKVLIAVDQSDIIVCCVKRVDVNHKNQYWNFQVEKGSSGVAPNWISSGQSSLNQMSGMWGTNDVVFGAHVGSASQIGYSNTIDWQIWG